MAEKQVDQDPSEDLQIPQEESSFSRQGVMVLDEASSSSYSSRYNARPTTDDDEVLVSAVSGMSLKERHPITVGEDSKEEKSSDYQRTDQKALSSGEKLSESKSGEKNTEVSDDSAQSTDVCPICLQAYVHAVKLPCMHVYCYLCLKGMAARDLRCGMCRSPFPREFLSNPSLVGPRALPKLSDLTKRFPSSSSKESGKGEEEGEAKGQEETFVWFYQAKSGGWWVYEERICRDLEEAFNKKLPRLRVFISGYQYIVDFKEMKQYREAYPDRARLIKRDLCSTSTTDIKGVAGIKVSTE